MSIPLVMTRTVRRLSPEVERAISKNQPPPIQLQTENGFSIVRRCDYDGQSSVYGTEHCFEVRDPHGYELDVTVDFSDSAIAEAIKHSRGRLTLACAFWITAAERHLADYLWENEDYPPDAKITIEQLTIDEVDLAQRWHASGNGVPKHSTGNDQG